jgi:Toprim domain
MGSVREPSLGGGQVESNRGQSLAFKPPFSSPRRPRARDALLRTNVDRGAKRAKRLGAGELAHRLAQHAEAVCRQYLSNGHRDGGYWRVGDVANSPGRSLYVRLTGSRAGKWCDAATAEHGDLLDLIAVTRNLPTVTQAMYEAREFLALPADPPPPRTEPRTSDKTRAAQRLFGMGSRLSGTLAETYLRHRGIALDSLCTCLRFHPSCYYRDGASQETRPALLAAITDLDGRITGVQRTWLDACGRGKAQVATPRRTLGRQLGNGVRFGRTGEVMLAGEGIETVLSLKTVLTGLPMVAALSASNLGTLVPPPGLKRLYVARDRDTAGYGAFERLARRARSSGVAVFPLDPIGGDFNDDLVLLGGKALRAVLGRQMVADDIAFLRVAHTTRACGKGGA